MKIRLKVYQTNSNPRIKYDLKKLEDTNVREQFLAKLGGRFAPLLHLPDLTELEEGFTRDMNGVAEDTLGRKKKIKRPWITKETLKLCEKWRVLKKRWFDRTDQHATNHTLEYKTININIPRELWAAKDKSIVTSDAVILNRHLQLSKVSQETINPR